MSLADLLKKSDYYEDDRQVPTSKPNPRPPYTIHTLIGDIRRQIESGSIEYSDYKMDRAKCLLLIDYYNEKEGKADG